jgi:hypothetical protein
MVKEWRRMDGDEWRGMVMKDGDEWRGVLMRVWLKSGLGHNCFEYIGLIKECDTINHASAPITMASTSHHNWFDHCLEHGAGFGGWQGTEELPEGLRCEGLVVHLQIVEAFGERFSNVLAGGRKSHLATADASDDLIE